MSTWKVSPFVAFTVTRSRPSRSAWTRALYATPVARRASAARGLAVFRLRETWSGSEKATPRVSPARLGGVEELAEDRAGIPVPRDEKLVRVLDPLGEGHGPHRDAGRLQLPLQCVRCFASRLVAVERQDHPLHPLALQQIEVVRREAVRAVDRDRDRDAGLVEGQRIEDGLGEDRPRERAARPGSSGHRGGDREGSSAAASSSRGRRGSSTGR